MIMYNEVSDFTERDLINLINRYKARKELPVKIYPDIKRLQKEVNQIYDSFEVEDCVKSHINNVIAKMNKKKTQDPRYTVIDLNGIESQLLDWIYSTYNAQF